MLFIFFKSVGLSRIRVWNVLKPIQVTQMHVRADGGGRGGEYTVTRTPSGTVNKWNPFRVCHDDTVNSIS